MSDQAEVLISQSGGIGKIVLNRPKALNALTLDMCHAIEGQMRAWATDDTVRAVVVRGAGEKAFCAGGDIRRLADKSSDYPFRFWRDEYRLNGLIKHYPKPYVALVDGISMGGGVGVSAHGSHRVVSEYVMFAMPETGIGLFPDVGGSYVLSRMPGEIGVYLGLTGARLKAADVMHAGYGTHYVTRDRMDALEQALAAATDVDAVLAGFATDAGPAPLADLQGAIDRLFAHDTVEAIFAALQADGSPFATETLETLRHKSPFSLKLTLRQIREGRALSFDDCMRMEWRMASRIPETEDFYEGVRAVIIDKDHAPKWQPASLDGVTEAMIARHFAPKPGDELELN